MYGAPVFKKSSSLNDTFSSWNGSIMDVLEQLRNGTLKPEDLNKDLFTATKDKLLSGVEKGGKVNYDKIDYATKDYNLLQHMRTNVYAFAGAKTDAHLRALNNLLLDDKGNIVSKAAFKEKAQEYRKTAMGLEEKYNNTWLDAEYDTAIAQAQNAVAWQEYMGNLDLYPNGRYVTAQDEHVCPVCGPLNDIIKPFKDPFWATHAPVRHFRCKCSVEPTDQEPSGELPPGYAPVNVFEGNIGQGDIFSEKHPYYAQSKARRKKVQNAVDGYYLQERITANKAVYNDYASDNNYIQELFDDKTGGFVVRHKAAQFDAAGRPKSEQQVIDSLVASGNRIVIPEYQTAPFTKNYDLQIDFSQWDVKQIKGDVKNRVEEGVRKGLQQADNILLYFTTKPDKKEIVRALGNLKNVDRLNSILCIINDERIVISKAEILRGDYSMFE